MKRILFMVLLFGVALGLGTGSAQAATFSSSHSGSCSGNIEGWGYFYAYTYQYAYQYAYIYNDTVGSESHSFSFTGFLRGANDARRVTGRDDKWLVYRSGDFDIAVPYVAGAGLFAKDNRDAENDWVKLCNY